MSHIDGALARKLEFDDVTAGLGIVVNRKAELRLTPRDERRRGAEKYQILEHRRHQAQIKARRLLDLL